MQQYLWTMLLVFLIMMGWIMVQHVARVFAARHPELGPFREEGAGCGTHCGCARGRCQNKDNCPEAKEMITLSEEEPHASS